MYFGQVEGERGRQNKEFEATCQKNHRQTVDDENKLVEKGKE